MTEAGTPLLLAAKWTHDCQGKMDYDGNILSISTRYWPGSYQANGYVSAKSALVLWGADGEDVELSVREFEAEDFATLAPRVEEWAQGQMDRAVRALRAEFAEAHDD